ncbi:MAG: DUF697 domain-containing protein [SAR324 cluster bacterium]|nr:DUF697 domain-containing protein [SAR324 cluster bacterium]
MANSNEEEQTKEDLSGISKTKEMEGNGIIKNSVLWSMGVGLIPVPVVDVLGTTAIQLRMLQQLSKLYEVDFSENWGKPAIGSLVGGLGSGGLARVGASAIKMVPFVGTIAGMISSPLASGASTYAIGKVFLQHFESGGTFLDFNPEKVRGHFKKLYQEGKLAAAKIKTNLKSA